MNKIHHIEAVILANGDYPSASLPQQILKEAPYVVCCDGGANEYIAQGNLPDVIIGDGDSLSEENRLKYASILHHNPDQETNDQTKAVQFLLAKGITQIAIVGATGKREDHTIGNISFTAKGLKSRGLTYPIYDFTTWWQGTLNRCTDASFTIEAEGEYLVFINY